MLDKSITFKSINTFISELAFCLSEFDPSISIIRFGSTLNYLPESNLDIDIILLSEKQYFDRNITDTINNLRNSLIEGKSVMGYPLNNDALISKVNELVSNQTNFRNTNVYPKFIFGPLIFNNEINSESNIYLHFKGPLSISEFNYFCEQLPFHGYSILRTSKVVSNNSFSPFDIHSLSINKETLIQFNDGLKNRVELSTSFNEVIKCTKKIILNYNIFLDFNNINEKFSKELNQTLSIRNAKLEFVSIYNKINQLI